MSEANSWSPEWSNAVFPLEERDLRWGKVRRLMARDGVDAIICLPNTHNYDRAQADSRYLTQLGENGDETTVAFPVEGDGHGLAVARRRLAGLQLADRHPCPRAGRRRRHDHHVAQ